MPTVQLATSPLDLEQARDLRRSVLCGEMSWSRDAVQDGWDDVAVVALALDGEKPVATGRLVERGGLWQVDLLAVLPKYRRQGLGRQLVDFLVAQARTRQVTQVWAIAGPDQSPFFQACSFDIQQPGQPVALYCRRLN